tara:strand:+ start:24463 stop:24972 length:510 start_codon:yes stop_codon:yes gene_type:complete
MNFLAKILVKAADWTSILAGIAIVAMMLQVTVDVTLRYLFGMQLMGTLTIVSYYYMVIVAFVPLALAERRGAHISVEFVTDHLPPRIRHHLAGLILLPTAAVGFILTWRTFETATRAFRTGAAEVNGFSRVPVWPAYYALPLGAGLMTLIIVLKFAAYALNRDIEELEQ